MDSRQTFGAASLIVVACAAFLCPALFAGCRHLASNEKRTDAEITAASARKVPAPTLTSIVMPEGGNLGEVAEKAYGHQRFAGFVASINGLTDPERVRSGAAIQTPALDEAFEKEHADPQFAGAIHLLSIASTDYFALLPNYLKIAHPSVDKAIPVSQALRERLTACADCIDAANGTLSAAKAPLHPPKMAIGQFAKTSELLRALAAGYPVDEYTRDTIGQRLGLGFTDLIIWTENRHQ